MYLPLILLLLFNGGQKRARQYDILNIIKTCKISELRPWRSLY